MFLKQIEKKEVIEKTKQRDYKKYGWKNIAIKLKENDLILFNRQLEKLGF